MNFKCTSIYVLLFRLFYKIHNAVGGFTAISLNSSILPFLNVLYILSKEWRDFFHKLMQKKALRRINQSVTSVL